MTETTKPAPESDQPTNTPSPAGTLLTANAALVLVSTPIGNLKDISDRAREALRNADAILCEDTRTSSVLLRANDIKNRLIALHDHNEADVIHGLLAAMQSGARYVLISDAGTPLVSDPGYRLVRAAITAGLRVGGIPGPNAALLALTLSGLPPHPFMFLGFLPAKAGARQAEFARLRAFEAAGLRATLIFYEAPHRLEDFLSDAAATFGDRPAAICRELTKHYEEVRRGPVPELAGFYATHRVRGEITVVLGPADEPETTPATLDMALRMALAQMSLKDAVSAVSEATGLARKKIYSRALEINQK